MKITKKTTFKEILEKKPEAIEIMMKYGLHCAGCHAAAFESVEEGAKAHGMNEKEIKKMLEELNK